jgi:hypothetical protein
MEKLREQTGSVKQIQRGHMLDHKWREGEKKTFEKKKKTLLNLNNTERQTLNQCRTPDFYS